MNKNISYGDYNNRSRFDGCRNDFDSNKGRGIRSSSQSPREIRCAALQEKIIKNPQGKKMKFHYITDLIN